MIMRSCPIQQRQEADPTCLAECVFQQESSSRIDELLAIRSALTFELESDRPESDIFILQLRLKTLDNIVASQEYIAERAALTCLLPETKKRFMGLGGEAIKCTSQVAKNYSESARHYSPAADALHLIARSSLAREFYESVVN
jgi:hypothetical protein